jgi:hypothetical protein
VPTPACDRRLDGGDQELLPRPQRHPDFELIDTSLEGAIRGARPDEQERLARLSDQLRQLLRDSGRFSLVDMR